MSPLLDAAVGYAKAGWCIFPVKPHDKTPLTPHGLKDASNKVDTVRQWWAKWPNANIGLNCGKSGFVVIDLDKRGEYDGLQEWADITTRYGLTIATSVSITGGGGRHLVFKAPKGVTIKNSAGKLAPGIDVRAEGGYIVLPPSIHPNATAYKWDTNQDIEILPDQIVNILTTEPDPWKIFTLKDAAKPRPPLVWVVDGIVPAGSLSLWYGAPGSLKSMILADMCVCVADGKRWLAHAGGGGGYATTKGGVLWIDFDNGQRRTHERFDALSRSHATPQDAPLYYASMPEPALDAGDTDSMGALANRIISLDVSLVVIDNLGVVTGNADENSAEMQRPMGGLRWLSETTGAAVIVIHHQRKSNGADKTRTGDTIRGHSSIEAKLDLGMLISRDGPNIILSASKERGPQVKSFGATLAFESDPSRELKEARFWPYDIDRAEEENNANLETTIREELIKFGPMSANMTYDRIGGNRAEVLDLLKQMVKDGRVGQRQGARGLLLYIPQDKRQ